MDKLCSGNWAQIEAHGLHVGLPEGLMGNSEVGHLNIGAGRVIYQVSYTTILLSRLPYRYHFHFLIEHFQPQCPMKEEAVSHLL